MFSSASAALDFFPEAVLTLRSDRLLYANTLARHYIPQLEEGQPLPPCLDLPLSAPTGAGIFSSNGASYAFSAALREDTLTLLFHPAPQTALTDLQLEGVTGQLREFLNDILLDFAPQTVPGACAPSPDGQAGFVRSFHRMFRLVENLDYLRRTETDRPPFRPVSLDLVGLCRYLTAQAGDLLASRGTALHFSCSLPSLPIQGDADLLRRLLLELIANSARRLEGGSISLDLHSRKGRAVLTLSDTGAPLTPRQLSALLRQDTPQAVPMAEQGAGLGMDIARHITALHGGTLLIQWGDSSPVILLSFPLSAPEHHTRMQSPNLDTSGGMDLVLVGLSDVLPPQCFRLEGLD